jgi:3-phenylpropionate/cinnamic acid dioxygenase small subunit
MPPETWREIEAFLHREAALLDDRMWDEWLSLFTEDGIYWVPSVPGQKDPIDTISLFHEDRTLREMRVLRLRHPRAYSQEFPTRLAHVVTGAMPDPAGGKGLDGGTDRKADIVIRSSQHILEYRKEDQRMFGGTVRHWLRRDGAGWKIALKRIDLVNCDAPMETIQLFL